MLDKVEKTEEQYSSELYLNVKNLHELNQKTNALLEELSYELKGCNVKIQKMLQKIDLLEKENQKNNEHICSKPH
jgi:transcriptional antiterminator